MWSWFKIVIVIELGFICILLLINNIDMSGHISWLGRKVDGMDIKLGQLKSSFVAFYVKHMETHEPKIKPRKGK